MHFVIITLFPDCFRSFLETSLIGKAVQTGLLQVEFINPRDFADPPHFHVDDKPYGGGPGMVMLAEPLCKAIENAQEILPQAQCIYLSPTGILLNQAQLETQNQQSEFILLCGRYEGIDQRIIDLYVDLEISIGDYILMGGELPAMVFIESLTRLKDHVLGNDESVQTESFSITNNGRILEAPQYSRPSNFRGNQVPEVLLSGNHQLIKKWRSEQALQKTKARRPELLEGSKK